MVENLPTTVSLGTIRDTILSAPNPSGGRGLGGSSILNGLYYGRGSANVYDHWVQLGNPGWSWEEVFPKFIKVCSNQTIGSNDFFDLTWLAGYSLQPAQQ